MLSLHRVWKCLSLIRLRLAGVAIFPVIAGLRESFITLFRLWAWEGFLGLPLFFVECFLGKSWFVHIFLFADRGFIMKVKMDSFRCSLCFRSGFDAPLSQARPPARWPNLRHVNVHQTAFVDFGGFADGQSKMGFRSIVFPRSLGLFVREHLHQRL